MNILLMIHSIVRWVIVAVGLIAIIKFLIGLAQKKDFDKMDRGLSAGFSGLMDLQVTLGLLYFIITGVNGAGFPMFRIEHMITMVIAAAVTHIPSVLKEQAGNRHMLNLVAILGALILVVVGVYQLPGGWSR